jgi:hypothetical protein
MKNYHREITEKSIKKAEMRTYLAPHPKITHNPHRIKSMAYKEMFYICSRITPHLNTAIRQVFDIERLSG